jgi:hypothetical protein
VFTLEDAVYVATESNYLRRIEVESLATLEKVRPVSIVARQRLGRNVTAVTNTHATIEELLDASFSMWPLSYQGKWSISSSQDRLCGLVVRVSGYRSRGPGFDSRRFQIF